jgi:hypothetical protein
VNKIEDSYMGAKQKKHENNSVIAGHSYSNYLILGCDTMKGTLNV